MRFAALLCLLLTLSCRSYGAPTNQLLPGLFSPAEPPAVTLPVEGADTKVPVIFFDRDVDDEGVDAAIKEIDKANDNGAKAIVLELDTYGGSVDAGRKLVKAIERSKAPVHCVADGNAMSMGFYLLQSCDTRTMTDESVLMIHGITSGGEFAGKAYQWESRASMLQHEDEAFCKHEARRMKLTAEQLCEKVRFTEWFLDADEALSVQAVDAVASSYKEVANALRAGKSWPRPIVEVSQPQPAKK
jgi:ATP-dependent protease ClpP protease subunit